MQTLLVPAPLRDKLGDASSDALVTLFADAHRIAMEGVDRRLLEMEERFERRLSDEISKFRVEMVDRMSNLRFDILKWNFVFWIGQLAAMTAILNLMLRGLR